MQLAYYSGVIYRLCFSKRILLFPALMINGVMFTSEYYVIIPFAENYDTYISWKKCRTTPRNEIIIVCQNKMGPKIIMFLITEVYDVFSFPLATVKRLTNRITTIKSQIMSLSIAILHN